MTGALRINQLTEGLAVLVLPRRLDLDSARQVQDVGRDLMSRAQLRWILMDCGPVQFLDSTGLASLVMLHTQMQRRGGGVALMRVGPQVMQALTTAGEDSRFQCFRAEGEAIAALLRA
jgi:anti-anti-sigma factor